MECVKCSQGEGGHLRHIKSAAPQAAIGSHERHENQIVPPALRRLLNIYIEVCYRQEGVLFQILGKQCAVLHVKLGKEKIMYLCCE